MQNPLDPQTIAAVASVLESDAVEIDGGVRIEVQRATQSLALELHPALDGAGCTATIYTAQSLIQLQQITQVFASAELGEVILASSHEGRLSGVVIEQHAACAMYANLDQKLTEADFTTLPPPLVMGSLALSLLERPDVR